MRKKSVISLGIALMVSVMSYAGKWTTHFAYNNVTQIAMSPDKVYAVSDGNLFSVNKMTEEIEVYSRQSGLHASGITCIHYDETGEQLIICYATGKIDILSSNGVQYIGGLYDKDMTQRKTIYNVTISGRIAYLATHYGVQTMDLRENKMVDSYWLRPGGLETEVKDVKLTRDSIYAFTDNSLFSASRQDNLVDYHFWKREIRSGRISPDTDKGSHYTDGSNEWYRGFSEGIIRYTASERITYQPDGPLFNTPYRITATQGNVWVVQGGRWASQYYTPGHIMRYDGDRWRLIHADSIKAKTGMPVLDFMSVAVDPANKEHFYVTSYGTGLYEFDHDTLVSHAIADGTNPMNPSAADATRYTRLDFATFDTLGNLWYMNAGPYSQLQCIRADGTWIGQTITIGTGGFSFKTPGGLVLDKKHPNYVWTGTARSNTGLCLVDNQGTAFDPQDDQVYYRAEWTDQQGRVYTPNAIYWIMQDHSGRVWIATDAGVAYVESGDQFKQTDAIIRPEISDSNGEFPLQEMQFNAMCVSQEGEIWLGSSNLGIYVLNSAANTILAHYTTENSAMPSNSILSMACDENGIIWIGTGEGLVRYEPDGSGEEITGLNEKAERELEEGDMLRWKLHFSYSNAQEVMASSGHIYALANGSLFSVDRADGSITRWSKANGLNGSSIDHIIYDGRTEKLIIAYQDGRVDLLNDDGKIEQMPDIYMKGGSVAASINSLSVGSKQAYLAMPFGIIAIDSKKAEVKDTYYIGTEASSVDVQQVIEMGDSLYAFSYDRLYCASMKDNMVDYHFWHNSDIPFEKIEQAAAIRDKIYVLDHDSLYRRDADQWRLVSGKVLAWIHVCGQRMLTFEKGVGLLMMDEEENFSGLSGSYIAQDAVYSNGEYWLGEAEQGLVKLNQGGDEFYRPEGPINNFGYKLQIAHGQVYVSPGGRWAAEYARWSGLSILRKDGWKNISLWDVQGRTNHYFRDAVSYAVDPQDAGHFFVATYGTGVVEFKDYQAVQYYGEENSTLRRVGESYSADYFLRTDGAMMDKDGYLWVANATSIGEPLHVRTPEGRWVGLRLRYNGTDLRFKTPGDIYIDRRDSRYKWLIDQRSTPGVFFFYDGGTPTNNSDDKCIKRDQFTDQNGNIISPTYIYCMAQDKKNRWWIGTEKGILLIPANVDFFTSGACRRIIVPRNDGTGLGDYLLGEEQIKCMTVDGGDRMWIGTASSGVYVIEDDTITAAHFTENNSLLPSNSIQSIAIDPNSGEVFVGTDKGIASYRADASEAQEKMNNVYAYPNPVRPDYGGYISITGLMENTTVNIVDAGGNLVCKTRSHGGTAVWDGKLPDGRLATPGVYTALCNANGGSAVVKILIIR